MKMLEEEKRNIITDFINCYRLHPILWNVDHKDYNNNSKREKAYSELMQIYRKINAEASIKDTARKINTLRSNYLRERKRQKRLKQQSLDDTRNSEDDKPSLFYYDTLSFLDPILDTPKKKNGNDLNLLFPNKSQMHEDNASETEFQFSCKSNFVDVSTPLSPDAKQSNQSNALECELRPYRTKYERPLRNYDEDEADIFGRAWSLQFRNLTEDQKIFTKKAFEDILFEASLGTLHRNSIKINDSLCQHCQSSRRDV